MSWLFDITRSDRLAAERITGCSFTTAEIVSKMLDDIWVRWFSMQEQQAFDCDEAAEIGRSIYAAFYMLNDAVRDYHLEMGHYDEDGVQRFRETAQRYDRTCEAHELIDEAGVKGVRANYLKDEDVIASRPVRTEETPDLVYSRTAINSLPRSSSSRAAVCSIQSKKAFT